jgi:hypothetical protein
MAAERVFFGGPVDGQTTSLPPHCTTIDVPTITTEYSQAYNEWFTTHGTTHAVCQVFDREWTGPPPPPFPRARYVQLHGSHVLAYAGMH